MTAAEARARATVLGALRGWFAKHGYLESITPVVVPSGAMEEHLHPVAAAGGVLRTSPEFALKGLMGQGMGRIYEIGPCLREREAGPWHRREFVMCEWYRAGAELADLMDDVAGLVEACALAVGVPVPQWRQITVRDAFCAATGTDPFVQSAVELSGIDEPWDDAFLRRWVTDVEPSLTGAVFVTDFPASQAALARTRSVEGTLVASRFEAYLGGVELANAFFELLDPAEHRRRAAEVNQRRVAAGEPPHPAAPSLLEAVATMPRTSGIALGVDRLVAVLHGWGGLSPVS